MAYLLRSARYLAAECQQQVLMPGDRVVDATMGNGQDTCALAEWVGDTGRVFAFDIQADAVEHTRQKLLEAGLLDRCVLNHLGHEHISEVVHEPIKAAVYNLGWLPGGNKTVTTTWDTTIKGIEACLSLLVPGGVCTICAYPGHTEGNRELQALTNYAASLRPQDFTILHQHFLNAGAGAPECFILQKQL